MSAISVREFDNVSTSSSKSQKSSNNELQSGSSSPSTKSLRYSIKTLCFARKSLVMPSKQEYSVLLNCGLGARKWQIQPDADAEKFRKEIYKIYPRLTSVPGYTLWNIKKDKSFEKLPAKVNTPSRIRAYLGNQFTGCLLIMPLEEIPLVSPSVVAGSTIIPATKSADTDSRSDSGFSRATGSSSQSDPGNMDQLRSIKRSFCLMCGKVPKQISVSAFFDVDSAPLPRPLDSGFTTISRRLRDILQITEEQRNVLVPSKEICKRCFRQIVDIDFMENQLLRAKEHLLSQFLATVAKVSKISTQLAPQVVYPKTQTNSSPPSIIVTTASNCYSATFTEPAGEGGGPEANPIYRPVAQGSHARPLDHAFLTSRPKNERILPDLTAKPQDTKCSFIPGTPSTSEARVYPQVAVTSVNERAQSPVCSSSISYEERSGEYVRQIYRVPYHKGLFKSEPVNLIPVNLAFSKKEEKSDNEVSQFNKAAVAAARCTTWVQDSDPMTGSKNQLPPMGGSPKEKYTSSGDSSEENGGKFAESSRVRRRIDSTSSMQVVVDNSNLSEDSSRSCCSDSGVATSGNTTNCDSSSKLDPGSISEGDKESRKAMPSFSGSSSTWEKQEDKPLNLNSGNAGDWSRSSSITPSPPSSSSSPEQSSLSDPQSQSGGSRDEKQPSTSWKKRYCEMYGGEDDLKTNPAPAESEKGEGGKELAKERGTKRPAAANLEMKGTKVTKKETPAS